MQRHMTAYSSIAKMEAVISSESSMSCRATCHHIPDSRALRIYGCENLRSNLNSSSSWSHDGQLECTCLFAISSVALGWQENYDGLILHSVIWTFLVTPELLQCLIIPPTRGSPFMRGSFNWLTSLRRTFCHRNLQFSLSLLNHFLR
jgi:hypothetical protein